MNIGPGEAAEGIRKLLRATIGPELGSEQAVFTLRRIMTILRETNWDDAAFALMAENAALCTLAAQVGSVLDETELADGRTDALGRWRSLAARAEMPRSYAEAAEINARLRAAIADTIAELAATPSAAGARRKMIGCFLALHADA